MFNSTRGQSIIAAVVGIAIAISGFFLVSAFLNSSMKANKTVTAKSEFDSQVALISMALSRPSQCPSALQVFQSSTFVQAAPAATLTTSLPNLPDINLNRIAVGSNILASTITQVSKSFQIDSLTISQLIVGNPDPANSVAYVAQLTIKGTSTGTLAGGILEKTLPISLTIADPVSGNPVIQSCSVSGSSEVSASAFPRLLNIFETTVGAADTVIFPPAVGVAGDSAVTLVGSTSYTARGSKLAINVRAYVAARGKSRRAKLSVQVLDGTTLITTVDPLLKFLGIINGEQVGSISSGRFFLNVTPNTSYTIKINLQGSDSGTSTAGAGLAPAAICGDNVAISIEDYGV